MGLVGDFYIGYSAFTLIFHACIVWPLQSTSVELEWTDHVSIPPATATRLVISPVLAGNQLFSLSTTPPSNLRPKLSGPCPASMVVCVHIRLRGSVHSPAMGVDQGVV